MKHLKCAMRMLLVVIVPCAPRLAQCGVALFFLVAASAIAPSSARAATITVTNTNDSGAGSLRQAIANAAAGDTINFSLTYPATIVLASTLTINKNLTISGPGASSLTISGNNTVRVFEITGSVTVNISGVTIANGRAIAGSGIYSAGTLTVTNVIFSNNNATDRGTINNTGTLNVNGCTFSGNTTLYGGIHNDGAATVNSSTFTNNTANTGAGIMNHVGILTVNNSVFTSNSAIYGGAIFNDDPSTLTVSGSTFSNNNAPTSDGCGGGMNNEGTATVTNNTFTGNSGIYGGGLGNWGSLTITNNTFSNNSATEGGGIRISSSRGTATLKNNIIANSATGGNCHGTPAAGSTNNLATDATCTTGFTQVTPAQLALSALTGTPAFYPLCAGSSAIDAGTNTDCPATDQRGQSRPQDGDGNGTATCDVGSYEYKTFIPTHWLYLPFVKR